MGYGMNDRIENNYVGDRKFRFPLTYSFLQNSKKFPRPSISILGENMRRGIEGLYGRGEIENPTNSKNILVVVEKTEKCHKKRIKRKFMTPTHQSATSTIDNENWRFIIDPIDIDNRYCNNTHNHHRHHRWDLPWILELKVNNTG